MEFTELSEIIKNDDFKFQKHDYLYHHNKEGYPLKNDMNSDNLFFVIESSGIKVKIMSILIGNEKEISLSDSFDKWWFLRLPEHIKNKLF
ncbi:MAG: hypothetical protein WCY89_09170 [Flavobacteriaceae bacterium]